MTLRQDEIALNELEKHVWQDISRARSSHAVLEQFLKPVRERSSSHYRHRDVPLSGAIAHAAVDSLISALGRLLQPNPRGQESTIAQYRHKAISLIKERGKLAGASTHSIQSFDQLTDRQWLNALKKQQDKFTQEILPLRDKLVAHSEMGFGWSLFEKGEKSIAPCIEFVEKTHRICRSALHDAGNPGPYLDGRFGSVAQEWINVLQTRGNSGIG